MYDAIIAGAGPAGLYTAGLLEKAGLKVLVLEKKGEIGKESCSGLVSANLRDFVPVRKSFLEHSVLGCVLHSSMGTELVLKKDRTAAYVIDRKAFDTYLARGLKSRLLLNTGVDSVKAGRDSVEVRTSRRVFKGSMLIGCDGAGSVVRRHFGVRPMEVLKGLIGIAKKVNHSRYVELWFNRELSDGFFWKIPRGSRTEYGMLGTDAKFSQLERFFRLRDYEKRAGLIPVGLVKTYFPRTLLVGDAACQVKPWSGGGVVFGLTCARIASEVVLKAFGDGDFGEESLREYETRWMEAVGKQIKMGLMFRELYKDMDNQCVDMVFRRIKSAGAERLSRLDMDFIGLDSFL